MTVVPEVTERVNTKYGKVYADNADIGQKAFNDNTTFLKQELLKDYNQFVYNKRRVISDLYTDEINSFKARNKINDDSVLYEGIYTGSIIMYANDSEIKELAKDSSVSKIDIWDNITLVVEEDTHHDVIRTDNITGTKSLNYNNLNGFKGTGVNIGIIEAAGGKYQSTAKQLQGIHDTQLEYTRFYNNENDPTIEEEESEHATKVTSIIVGQSYLTYEGIVPNAKVYQASVANISDMFLAFQDLAEEGVSVINYSSGAFYTTGAELTYTAHEIEIDNLCNSTDITFIMSAGNRFINEEEPNKSHKTYDVVMPGKGYNIITVGNANTTTNVGGADGIVYNLRPSSCYLEASYLTEKPDLVAPGTEISCIGVNNKILTGSGTSYSAPMVTGVVAQLHQADPTLISNPTATKALILAGADPTVISTSNDNTTVDANNLIFEKSGVGMLNAVNSVGAAEAGNYGSVSVNLNGLSQGLTYTLGSQYINKDETIRIALTFNKPDDSDINSTYGNNVNLKLFATGAITVSHSSSTINNVEVLEYTATTSGEYYIVCQIPNSISVSNDMYLNISAAWRILHDHNYTDSYIGMLGNIHWAYCDCGVFISNYHNYTHSFSVINATYHYAICACGMQYGEGHTMISGPVGTYCQKCYYISSYN